jgi:hypothetical protein
VLFTPTAIEGDPQRSPPSRNLAIREYANAIVALGRERGLFVADLHKAMNQSTYRTRLTDNGLHFTDTGYAATAPAFLAALGIARPSETTITPALRAAVLKKNELFFHRWRPQNETYLFGFRKHEQGKNAKEIVEFDPLVAAVEKEIASLKPTK